jgi:hypothetical protein
MPSSWRPSKKKAPDLSGRKVRQHKNALSKEPEDELDRSQLQLKLTGGGA